MGLYNIYEITVNSSRELIVGTDSETLNRHGSDRAGSVPMGHGGLDETLITSRREHKGEVFDILAY